MKNFSTLDTQNGANSNLYYYDDEGNKHRGIHSGIRGNVSDIQGNVSRIQGDVSGIQGDVSGIQGDVSGVWGNVSGVWGNVSGIWGNVSGIRGNVSGIRGDVSGIQGDVSGIRGNVSNDAVAASFTQVCPQEGSFIAWKKCQNSIVKLLIPAEAQRLTSFSSRKCRTSQAEVLAIYDDKDGTNKTAAQGLFEPSLIYQVGEKVIPNSFDPNPRRECSNGIHFFITREEAERYTF